MRFALVGSIVAEIRQHARGANIWYLAAGSTFLATYLIPAPGSGYATMSAAGKVPLLTSGFAGTMSGALFATFFALPCFFAFGSTFYRDRQSGFGGLLAATPASNAMLVLSRLAAAFLMLGAIVAGAGVVLAGCFELRGQAPFDVLRFYASYLLFALPAVAFFSGLGVTVDAALREHRRGIRVAIGISVWLFLVMILIVPAASRFDVFGFASVQRSVRHAIGADAQSLAVGIVSVASNARHFTWNGVSLTADFVVQRLLIAATVVPFAAIAIFVFDRFRSSGSARGGVTAPIDADIDAPWNAFSPVHSAYAPHLWSLVAADTLLRIRTRPFTAYATLAAAVLFTLVDLRGAKIGALLLPFAWYLTIDSSEGTFGIGQLVFSMPHAREWYPIWKTTALAALPLCAVVGLVLHAALAQGTTSALLVVAGVLLECAWLVGCQLITGGPIFGLVTLLFAWYELAATRVPFFDYVGVANSGGETLIRTLLALALVAVGTSIAWATGAIGRVVREET